MARTRNGRSWRCLQRWEDVQPEPKQSFLGLKKSVAVRLACLCQCLCKARSATSTRHQHDGAATVIHTKPYPIQVDRFPHDFTIASKIPRPQLHSKFQAWLRPAYRLRHPCRALPQTAPALVMELVGTAPWPLRFSERAQIVAQTVRLSGIRDRRTATSQQIPV